MSESTPDALKPNRKFIDITFWVGHVGLILGIALVSSDKASGASSYSSVLPLILVVVGLIAIFSYFFAIGQFAKKMGRSPVVWGGLSFLFSPIGVWVSYIASFSVSPIKK